MAVSSHVAVQQIVSPFSAALHRHAILMNLRGGAGAAATLLTATAAATTVTGGASGDVAAVVSKNNSAKKKKKNAVSSSSSSTESFLGLTMSPEGKAVVLMAVSMALHYLGYSMARPVTVALFTSVDTGYSGFTAAFPFAMAFVSPFSLLLLMGYKNMLDRLGPGGALQQSTFLCAVTCLVSGIAIAVLQKTQLTVFGSIPVVKFLSGPLFIFRESYVQLLTSQYWSFMASALTPNQSAQWFGPIAGLTSIASAAAGFAVSPLVQRVGLSGVVCGTGLTLLLSMIGAKEAYAISDKYGFTPGKTSSSTKEKKKASSSSSLQQHKKSEDDGLFGLFQTAVKLFARVPVLGALFAEILASQGLATVLNVAFVARLGTAIPNDRERAGWVGIFFAVINLVTMVLQFSILPQIMKFIEPRDLWRVVPLVSCLSTTFQAFQKDPSLYAVSLSLLIMKVSEYSARRLLDEMVFVPLDFESRFVGKEVLGVFGYRFGKSLMSLVLSGITAIFGSCGLRELSVLSSMVSFAWLQTAWRVSLLVPTHLEAQEQHEKEKKKE